MPLVNRKPWRGARLTVLLVAGACLAGAPGASAWETKESAAEVRAYWTPERMASALPGDVLLADNLPVDPSLGGLGLASSRRGVSGQTVSNPSSKPFRTHGKVYFTLGGVGYVCSATSVRSKTKSLVVTAGHCMADANGYASKFEFVPAYNNGAMPYGEWVAKRLKTTPQWRAREDLRYDVGMATMRKTGGKRLANVVGARGIAFNRNRDSRFDVFGYPAESPYNGETMQRCDTQGNGSDGSMNDPKPTRIACDQTGGASGGGWIVAKGRVNGVISYGYDCGLLGIPLPIPCDNTEDGNLFGPYFGDEIRELYRSEKR
jgi:V8-like Glu-specific endopeptidase